MHEEPSHVHHGCFPASAWWPRGPATPGRGAHDLILVVCDLASEHREDGADMRTHVANSNAMNCVSRTLPRENSNSAITSPSKSRKMYFCASSCLARRHGFVVDVGKAQRLRQRPVDALAALETCELRWWEGRLSRLRQPTNENNEYAKALTSFLTD